MPMLLRLLATVLMLCPVPSFAADELKAVLARMDQAAAKFSGVRARVEKENFTAVINETDVDRGELWMSRKGKKLRLRIEFTEPDVRSVAMTDRRAEIYYPKINTVHEYDLGKHRDMVEQFLLLGFGTPGKKLSKDYRVKLAGNDELHGEKTAKLELVPKSRKARDRLLRVELWVADPAGYPVQQKFYWPSDDTTTIGYADVRLNPPLTDADVTLDLPADAKREFPQR